MNICFCGTHGAGKSTLVNLLHQRISDFDIIKNTRRILSLNITNFGTFDDGDIVSQSISTGYLAVELLSEKNCISERSLFDTFAYTMNSKISKEDADKIINMFIPIALKCHDVLFYIPIEFELEDDGFRKMNDGYRKTIDKEIKRFLDEYNVDYIELTGSVEDRMNKIYSILIEKEIIWYD